MIRCKQKDLGVFGNLVRKIKTAAVSSAITPTAEGIIYWHLVEPLTKDQPKTKTIKAFEKAFAAWSKHFDPIKFESTSDASKAAIRIHFMSNGDKKLPEKFDSGVLAYAFFPNKKSLGIHSDMYFNDSYTWAEMHSKQHINLFKVAVHEMGHAFGLDHSTILADIMYPHYQPNDFVNITVDTAKGIDKLYGKAKEKLKHETDKKTETPSKEDKPLEGTACKGFVRGFFTRRYQIRHLQDYQRKMVEDALGVPSLGSTTQRNMRIWKALNI